MGSWLPRPDIPVLVTINATGVSVIDPKKSVSHWSRSWFESFPPGLLRRWIVWAKVTEKPCPPWPALTAPSVWVKEDNARDWWWWKEAELICQVNLDV